jgi:hypothetical protein
MAGPIYKVWFMKYKEPWYKLTTEEQNKLMQQNQESMKQVGCELMMMCASVWSSEEWLGWGVEKYADIEAVQKRGEDLYNMKWFEYIESITYLGTEMPQA